MIFSHSKILYSVFALCLLLNLTACGGPLVAEFTEEVKLHDGQMIHVWRKSRSHKPGWNPDGSGGLIDYELKYEPLGVTWKHSADLTPVSFELFNGVAHLVLIIRESKDCQGKKDLDYAAKFLVWNKDKWDEVAQADFPVDKALMNLYRGEWDEKDPATGLIKWEKKGPRDGYFPDKPDTIKDKFEKNPRTCKFIRQS
jgi:hypothetical protein